MWTNESYDAPLTVSVHFGKFTWTELVAKTVLDLFG
jgi:hypothetical protein